MRCLLGLVSGLQPGRGPAHMERSAESQAQAPPTTLATPGAAVAVAFFPGGAARPVIAAAHRHEVFVFRRRALPHRVYPFPSLPFPSLPSPSLRAKQSAPNSIVMCLYSDLTQLDERVLYSTGSAPAL